MGDLGFPDRSVESTYNAGDPGSIPGLGRSPGEGNSYPLQYSGLQNSIDYIVHGGTIVQGQAVCGHEELDTTEGLSLMGELLLR